MTGHGDAGSRIREHRMGKVRLTVLGKDGKPVRNARVKVRQTNHKFLFGCNIFRLQPKSEEPQQKEYQRRFSDLLNYATVPFYWAGYEKEQGQTAVQQRMNVARWCMDHGIKVKGHTLCYHMTTPAWVNDKPFAEIKALQFARITREVEAFRGLVDIWDVINEAVWTPGHEGGKHPLARVCRKMGRVGLVKETFARARAANPKSTLLINDCDPTPAYEKLVRESLQAKVEIDVIGIQSHMHKGYWGPEKAWAVCEQYAKFGKPLHFTEMTILSGIIQPEHSWSKRRDDWFSTPEGEEKQAEQVTEMYRLLFSHPSVHGITWWDFSDDNAWLGAPAGLVRKDMSLKPAYEALMKLVKGEWWSGERVMTTDDKGQADVEGFLGEYQISAGRQKAVVTVSKPGMARKSVTLGA